MINLLQRISKGFLGFAFLRANEYFRTETVKLPKKKSAEVFNI